jgi:uncharacterized protein YkwD
VAARAFTLHARKAVVVACAVLALIASLTILPTATAGALDGNGQDWLAKINSLRSSVGVGPLQLDGELTGLAQGWSEHMAATGTLSHTPNMANGISSSWTKLGENVGYGSNNDAIWGGFLRSSPHYANLVDPAFTHVGIGVAWVGGTQFVTHRFMAVGGGGGGGGGGGSYEPAPTPAPRPRSTAPPTTAPAEPAPEEPEAPAAAPAPTGPEPGRVAAVLDALHAVGT